MKKSLYFLIPIAVIIVYMMAVWFLIPSHSPIFGADSMVQNARELGVVKHIVENIYQPILVALAVFFVTYIFVYRVRSKTSFPVKTAYALQIGITTVCSVLYTVFKFKPELFKKLGVASVDYVAQTIILNADNMGKYNKVVYALSAFDILFALLTALIFSFIFFLIEQNIKKTED